MKPFEEELRGLVRDWLRKADLDFEAVARLAPEGDRFRDIVGFHAQQAVEKYLKALLVRHQVEFPRAHDIERLLRLLQTVEPAVAQNLADTAWLTPFGVEIRYPGDFPETLPGDEIRALELAQRTKDAVMGVLGPFLAGTYFPRIDRSVRIARRHRPAGRALR